MTVITYRKIREWQELFLVYENYLLKIDFLSFFTRTEEIERSSQLRTRAMREAEKRPSKTYRFTLIRVRFPDGYILQGTCKHTACKSTRFYTLWFSTWCGLTTTNINASYCFLFGRYVLFPRKTSGCVRVCSPVTRVRLAAVCIVGSHWAAYRWKCNTYGPWFGK